MIKINVLQLDNAGTEFSGSIPAEQLNLQIVNSASNVKFCGDVEYVLHASAVSGGVLVVGKISVAATANCGRCLANYNFTLELNDICHYYEEFTGDELDITDDLREDFLIALPSKFLCCSDCRGLCTSCGANLNNKECSCETEQTSSASEFKKEKNPWSALDSLEL